jgi:dihydropteroate synthase
MTGDYVADRIYLRPVGMLWGRAAAQALADGLALPLAGGPAAFLAAELIEGEAGAAKRVVARASTLAAIDEPAVKDLLARIASPRPSVAGLDFGRTLVMGIVNATPDSFSDGGDYNEPQLAAERGRALAAEGAAIIDIGGESTRPGAEAIPVEEEKSRVLPVISGLAGLGAPISIDTRKAAVMEAAAAAGASILNDVSALAHDPDSMAMAARLGLPVILMHAQGDPRTMQDNPTYSDALLEVYDYLEARIEAAVAAGVRREAVIADPGIGFGKRFEHNLALIEGLSLFHGLGAPILVGISRKGVTGQLANEPDPKKRDFGSVAAAVAAASQGVQIVRAHNVSATRQALNVWRAAATGENLA